MKYTRVRRAVSAVVIDSWDKDRDPEHIKVNGRVTFTPLLKDGDVVQWAGPNGPESLVLAPIECRISDGIIMHRGGEGVYLAAGGEGCEPSLIQWKATFSNMQAGGWAFKLKPVMFDAIPDGEVDLTMVAPVAGASEPIVRGPAGTGIDNIKVDGAELVITARSEAGTFEMARIPLEDVVKAEADAAAKSAADNVRTEFTTAAANATKSATRAETAAGNAKQSETNAEDAARRASNSATSANRSSVWVSNAEQRAEKSASAAKADADRAANIANSTSWNGDRLTINGQTSPALTGPPGTTTWAGITNKPATFPPSTHTHKMADITDLPAVGYSEGKIAKYVSGGGLIVEDIGSQNTATSRKYVDTAVGAKADKSYVDTAVASEKARTVGMVWMVETEDAAQAKESSCQKGDFIQVAQTGNIYQVV